MKMTNVQRITKNIDSELSSFNPNIEIKIDRNVDELLGGNLNAIPETFCLSYKMSGCNKAHCNKSFSLHG